MELSQVRQIWNETKYMETNAITDHEKKQWILVSNGQVSSNAAMYDYVKKRLDRDSSYL